MKLEKIKILVEDLRELQNVLKHKHTYNLIFTDTPNPSFTWFFAEAADLHSSANETAHRLKKYLDFINKSKTSTLSENKQKPKKMIFYIDNKIDQKKDFSYKELIELFIQDKQAYNNLLHGQPFERCFLASMPGVPEPVQISDDNWMELEKEFKRQVPNPKYKV